MKKIDIFTIAALTVTLLPVSCQMEEPAEELTYTVNVPIVFGDNPTTEEADAIIEVKADVDGTSGVTTWTTGDQIAYYVSGAGANKYQVKTINGTIVPVSLTSSQSRGDFAVYPPASVNATYHTAANLKVKYPTTYDFSGMTALQMATFSPLPMVGDNTQPNIVLYNVGGLLRLTVNDVPAAAKYIKVTVPGMNITGDYTVYTPASTTPYVTATTGSNDNVTFQIAETTIGTQGNYTVNLPLPAGDYSGVTGKTITVEALNESSNSIAAANGAITHWTSLGRRKGKKLTVDFAPASFAINEGEATIWKSQTANFTTNATAGSVTWNSSTPTVATVNASGTVTGVSAGYTDITATLNGIKVSDPVRVYVNAVTKVTLASAGDKTVVGKNGTLDMTATIEHTENGAITSYPTVSWDSEYPAKITVPASSTLVYSTSSSATTTVAISGESAGSSSITASVNSDYVSDTGNGQASKTITCELITSITLLSSADMYKFRGTRIHPGFLQYDGADYSITPAGTLGHAGLDGLASLMAAYGTEEGHTKYYFSWTYLSTEFTPDDREITETIYTEGTDHWRIPNKDHIQTLGRYTKADPKINVNSVAYDYGYALVIVNLEGSPLEGKGLTTEGLESAGTGILDGGTVTRTNYILGVLLIPDGATITCERLNGPIGSNSAVGLSSNCITYDDLDILVKGGCVFLPAVGDFSTYPSQLTWNQGGTLGTYWSGLRNETISWYAYRVSLRIDQFATDTNGDTARAMPVFLVHE